MKYPLNVTIDSNIFDANRYDMAEDSTLSILISYVEKKKIKVYLSNIVVGEILSHIQDKAYEITASVNGLRKDLRKNYPDSLIKDLGMGHVLAKADRDETARKAKENMETFLGRLNAEILNNETVDADKIFNDYFAFHPPFENNDKKRKEFPDAFIAAQIRKKFPFGEKLAIVSNDKGFRAACGDSPDYMFFDSLGELFHTLSKEEQDYHNSVACIDHVSALICHTIEDIILDNDCVDVIGLACDKDGIIDGFDYSETIVDNVSGVSCKIHSIDEIAGENVFATLVCSADIDVLCYYKDYDNAAWDSEEQTYFDVETRKNMETHKARFAVRVEANMESEEFTLSKFKVRLGGDSRKRRFEIL